MIFIRSRANRRRIDFISSSSFCELLGFQASELYQMGDRWIDELVEKRDQSVVKEHWRRLPNLKKNSRLEFYFTAIAADKTHHFMQMSLGGVEWQGNACLTIEGWLWEIGPHGDAVESVLMSRQVSEGNFILHYQPIIDMKTKRIAGYEALARIKQNGRTSLPGSFLPKILGTHVEIELVQDQLNRIVSDQFKLLPHQFISYNLSLFALRNSDIVDAVAKAIKSMQRTLKIEISEECMIDQVVRDNIQVISNAGGHIWFDDVGVGYSRFSELQNADIAGFKIDRSVIEDCESDEIKIMLISTLATIAKHNSDRHGRRMEIVAEGVSHRNEEAALIKHGIRHGQGWLYSKAIDLKPNDSLMIESM